MKTFFQCTMVGSHFYNVWYMCFYIYKIIMHLNDIYVFCFVFVFSNDFFKLYPILNIQTLWKWEIINHLSFLGNTITLKVESFRILSTLVSNRWRSTNWIFNFSTLFSLFFSLCNLCIQCFILFINNKIANIYKYCFYNLINDFWWIRIFVISSNSI